jgi:diguanylate cyclase (GGDEF)-like protein
VNERRATAAGRERTTEEERGHGRISPETRHLLPVVAPVVALGAAVVAAAVWLAVADPPSPAVAAGVLALLAAALFSEAFPVPVENLPGGRLSLSTVFILGAAVLYGPSAAIAVAVTTRVTLELVERRPRVKLFYNGAVFGIAAAAASVAMSPFDGIADESHLLLSVLAGATAFWAVDVVLIAVILARWSQEPFLPLLRSAAVTTGMTFAIMGSVGLALVVLWTQHPALALVLVGPLVAVALHQRATHNALRAMRLALTDPLTGLGNHRHFQEQLQIQLEEASASRTPLTVCLFDLDDFKQINDRYGHPTGDRVLAHVASKLRGLGEAYRLGGDEFAVVFPGEQAEVAAAAAEELLRGLAEERWEQGGPLCLTGGIATYPDHSNDRNALVRVADIALYWAKGEGKNRVCVYRPDMPAVTQLRRLTRAPDRAARLQAAAALASAVDARDAFEGSHSSRVGDLAAAIAVRLRLPEEEVELVRLAGRLHDIGKLAVPEEILRKPGPLTRREKDVLESHPGVGHGMLLPLDIEPVPTWVLHHHERWDGTGVPSQLAGERIPLGARIIFAADAWDAMTNARPYSEAQTHAEAREELQRCSGRQFDPVVVEALLEEVAARPLRETRHLTVVA